MKKFRVENDINVYIKVLRDGKPDLELSSRNIQVFMKSLLKTNVKVERVEIKGPILHLFLPGSTLKTPGIYYFTIYDVGKDLSLTSVDTVDAFELYPRWVKVDGVDDTLETVTESTSLEAQFSLDGYDYNELKNKPSINGKTLQGNLTSKDLGLTIEGIEAYVSKKEFEATVIELKKSIDSKPNKSDIPDVLEIKKSITELKQGLDGKANSTDVYSKKESEEVFVSKTFFLSKHYVEESVFIKEMDKKADANKVYTKKQTDDKFLTKEEALSLTVKLKTVNGESLYGEGNIDINMFEVVDELPTYPKSKIYLLKVGSDLIAYVYNKGWISIGVQSITEEEIKVLKYG